MSSTQETIGKLVTSGAIKVADRKHFDDMAKAIESLRSEKSAEQKQLEALLAVTTDDSFKKVLNSQLAKFQEKGEINTDTALKACEALGLNAVDVIRNGIGKILNGKLHAKKVAHKKSETEKADPRDADNK